MGLAGETHDMHGRSFRAVVEGDAETFRETCVTGYFEGTDRVVRHHDSHTGRRWSLLLRPEGEPDELYDLVADPRERANLIDDHPDVATRLAGRFGPSYFRRRQPVLQVKGVQGAYEVASGVVE
jgi:hypothetical protein